MRFSVQFGAVSCVVVTLAVMATVAQEGSKPKFRSLAELDAYYRQQTDELERHKLLDMAALAGRLTGMEAETAYRAVFDVAVARGFFNTAEPAARAYLSREEGAPQSQALAAMIALIARADRGEYDRSLAELEGFLNRRAAIHIPEEQRLPAPLLFAVGEAYFQRLIQGGAMTLPGRPASLPSPTVPIQPSRRISRNARLGSTGSASRRRRSRERTWMANRSASAISKERSCWSTFGRPGAGRASLRFRT